MSLLTAEDWNFDNVPQHELAACCLWEYGRECIQFAISSAHHAKMMASFRAGQTPPDETDPGWESFLDAFWNCDQGYMDFYETLRNHGGPDALPWQRLPPEARKELLMQVGTHQVSKPCEVAQLGALERLWESNLMKWKPVRQEPGYDPEDDGMVYESSHLILEPPGHRGEEHGATVAAFTIDFRKFTDKQIGELFAAWLKENRPYDCPEPTTRGKKVRDIQVALDRLGIMRLLSEYTLREMPDKCPEAWKAFEGYDWYKERKRAMKTYQKLFPFLPKDDTPLSWLTKGTISKWAANPDQFAAE